MIGDRIADHEPSGQAAPAVSARAPPSRNSIKAEAGSGVGTALSRAVNSDLDRRRVARVAEPSAYASIRRSRPPSHLTRCGWFWAWAAIGGAGALGLISLGPIALVPAAIAGAAIAQCRKSEQSLFGLLAGAGLLSLFVAYVQRDGPGTTCWHTATSTGCDQHLNPIPWLVAGVLLILVAVVGQMR